MTTSGYDRPIIGTYSPYGADHHGIPFTCQAQADEYHRIMDGVVANPRTNGLSVEDWAAAGNYPFKFFQPSEPPVEHNVRHGAWEPFGEEHVAPQTWRQHVGLDT